jgi:hypothetical protein
VREEFPATGPSGPGAPQMRASDADRDRAVDVLRAATADGRLTPDEFSERMETALSARTLGELAGLTSDLALAQASDVARIDQRGGSVRREGRWVVPQRLNLRSAWCDVTLDFTDAVIVHGTLLIYLNVRGGTLALLTGPGIAVDADALRVRYTDVAIGPAAGPDAPVRLRVELAGRMRYGRIEARWPRAAGS